MIFEFLTVGGGVYGNGWHTGLQGGTGQTAD